MSILRCFLLIFVVFFVVSCGGGNSGNSPDASSPSSSPAPDATSSPAPNATPSPAPDATSNPVPTAEPEPTPAPSGTPSANPTPDPELTPDPSATAEPGEPSPEPTMKPVLPGALIFSVVNVFDKKDGKNYFEGGPEGSDPLSEVNSESEGEKLEILADDAHWWEFKYEKSDHMLGNPVNVLIHLSYRFEQDWQGEFMLEYWAKETLLASSTATADGDGLVTFDWDVSDSIASYADLVDGRLRLINNASESGKKIFVNYSTLHAKFDGQPVETPAPVATPGASPAPSPTPTPELTPAPTSNPEPTSDPVPSPTSSPIVEPTPQPTSMPTAAPGQSVLFAVIGDFGTDDSRESGVAKEIAKWNADFVVTVGDNRYSSRSMDAVIGKHYCDFVADVKAGSHCAGGNSPVNAFFPSPGNHDYDDGGGVSEYLSYFKLPGDGVPTSGTSGSERYYDFIQGPVHFFAIDSEGSSMSGQKAWLQNALQASTSPWKVVFFHHPPYSSARHGSQSFMQWDFAAWGADIVLAGHDHTYERIERDGILYFVNGLGGRTFYGLKSPVRGSKFRYNKENGAMRVRASSTKMTFEFVTRKGTVLDTSSVSK